MNSSAVDLACNELVELVTEYLARSLPPAERARFEAHLRECDPCTTYLEQMKTIVAASAALDEPPTREGSPELLEVFRRWKKK